jgi:stringent starvation protein B
MSDASTKPYLIRAIHEWCSDNGFTPYLAVAVDQTTQVPREYVRAGEIVLNVSLEATHKLQLGNEFIEFQARFGGKARDIMIPIANVSAIYARENGHGMSFEVPKPLAVVEGSSSDPEDSGLEPLPSPAPRPDRGGDGKRSNVRKLKSVSNRQPGTALEAEAAPDVAPGSARKVETLGSVSDTSENGRTSRKPLVAASPTVLRAEDADKAPGPTEEAGVVAGTAAVEGSGSDAGKANRESLAEPSESSEHRTAETDGALPDDVKDPGSGPHKPTGGKPKLTRVK